MQKLINNTRIKFVSHTHNYKATFATPWFFVFKEQNLEDIFFSVTTKIFYFHFKRKCLIVHQCQSTIFWLFSKKKKTNLPDLCIHICAFRDKFIVYIYWKTALLQRECKFRVEKIIYFPLKNSTTNSLNYWLK